MQSLGDILETIFTTAPCDFCRRSVPVYTDPETGCFYCLPCLEMATDETLALEDGPEDPEIVAMGRAVLDELLPTTARVAA